MPKRLRSRSENILRRPRRDRSLHYRPRHRSGNTIWDLDSSGEEVSFESAVSSFPNPVITTRRHVSTGTRPRRRSIRLNDTDSTTSYATSFVQTQSNVDQEDDDDDTFAGTHPGYVLFLFLVVYLLVLYGVYWNFPKVEPHERPHMKLPWNLQEAKNLAVVLDRYTDQHYYKVLLGFSMIYIFLQSFCIPGSIFLSIMSGFLFPFKTALFVVCLCAASGASFCYMFSWIFARKFVHSKFPEEIHAWTEKVNDERDNLINFMIALRITPILPNWFINIVAPLIGVPLPTFFLGTFIGVAPLSVLSIQGGKTLTVMTSPSDTITWGAIITLGVIALIVLMPWLLRRRATT